MKTAFIMRGIPGSGKSTTVRELIRGYDNLALSVAVHSTDDLCMVDGEYKFDIELAGARHAQNLENFCDSVADGVPCVICDNTNVKTAQYQAYVDAAELMGYMVVIVELVHPKPGVAYERNSHGVPLEVIERMISDWEPAQHCVTVENTKVAMDTVKKLVRFRRAAHVASFVMGAILCGGLTALAFLAQ
jgi:tRNA uridine 5-carbamoylmethylation protein Kti12